MTSFPPSTATRLGVGFAVSLAFLTMGTSALAQFSDVTSGPLGDSGTSFGVAWGDYDGDGDQDLYLTNGDSSSRLFQNQGSLVFSDVTSGPLASGGGDFGAAWGDYDNDGNLDLYIASGIWTNKMLRNDTGGVFYEVDPGEASEFGAQSVAWADYDQDGDLDVFVTYWGPDDKLYQNDGAGNFTDVTPAVMVGSGKSSGVAWADYDNDGDMDIYVGGRFSGNLYRNDGGGVFVDVSLGPLLRVGITGVAWGDYDNDGDLDLYLARNISTNRLLRNDSFGSTTLFTDVTAPALRLSAVSQGAVWFDFDNDGYLDLFVANAGFTNGEGELNLLARNNASGGHSFTAFTGGPLDDVRNSRGVAAADVDGDGFLDLYIANWGSPNQLLRGTLKTKKWLHIDLIGVNSNRFGVGARIRIVSGGTAQIREISAGSGLYSQNSLTAEFGLGTATTVDSLQIQWPSGDYFETTNLAANQRITVSEDTGIQTGIGDDPSLPPVATLLANAPNPFSSSTVIRYQLHDFSPVRLSVLDPLGRLVRVLETSPEKAPGSYVVSWDGRGENGRSMAQGVYFYSLITHGFQKARRMILLR